MTSFTDRERAAEAKFVHDEDVRFEERIRQIRRVGEWAGQQLASDEPEKQALYASEVVKAELGEPGAGLDKVRRDLVHSGIVVSDEEIAAAARKPQG